MLPSRRLSRAYLHRPPRPPSSKETLVTPLCSTSSSCGWQATNDGSIGVAARSDAESHTLVFPHGYQSSKNHCSSSLVRIVTINEPTEDSTA